MFIPLTPLDLQLGGRKEKGRRSGSHRVAPSFPVPRFRPEHSRCPGKRIRAREIDCLVRPRGQLCSPSQVSAAIKSFFRVFAAFTSGKCISLCIYVQLSDV